MKKMKKIKKINQKPVFLLSLVVILNTIMAANPRQAAEEFRTTCRRLAQESQSVTVPGKEGWLFLKQELRHIGVGTFWGQAAATASKASHPDRKDPLPAILDFKKSLDKAGIELMLLPVPPKAFIYCDKLPESRTPKNGRRLDVYHRKFYTTMTQKGVTVLDIYPLLQKNRSPKTPMYCRTDTHWSGKACVAVAEIIAEKFKKKPWFGKVPKQKFVAEETAVTIEGDLLRTLKTDIKSGPEKIALRFVRQKIGDKTKTVASDPNSPVLLMADSHGLVFNEGGDMHAKGAGLADQLAYELGFALDLLAVRGSGATPTRINLYRRAKKAGYLKTKKVIIWCFTAREFTETSGWAKIPLPIN